VVQRDIDNEKALNAKIGASSNDGEAFNKADVSNSPLKSPSEIQSPARAASPTEKSMNSTVEAGRIAQGGTMMGAAQDLLDEMAGRTAGKGIVQPATVPSYLDYSKEEPEGSTEHDSSLSAKSLAEKMEKTGILKIKMKPFSVFVLAVMAGAFISLGGIYFTFTTSQTIVTNTLTQILGGLMFSMGLIFVVIIGAEMFTSSTLTIVSLASRKVSATSLLRNWMIVYGGNIVGTLATVGIFYMSRVWTSNHYQFGIRALMIASHKTSLGFVEAFFLGMLCNCLVCIAVWLASGGKKISDKVLAIIFPVSAFVAMGFEHCVANMYFLSFAYVIKNDPTFISALQRAGTSVDLSHLTLLGIAGNLVPVTLGNIVGGAVLIGLANWLAYLRK